MRFDARAMTQAEFDRWVENVRATAPPLTQAGYDELAEPGTMPEQDYSSIPPGLFEQTVTKYIKGDSGQGHHHGGSAAAANEPNEPSEPESSDQDDNAMTGTHHH